MRRTVVLIAQLAVVVAASVVLTVAGLPVVVSVLAAAWIGGALVVRHMNDRRHEGAAVLAPHIEEFPLRVPVERVAVGRLVQVRLLPPTRGVWAPGVLGVAAGEVAFAPSKAKLADRAWAGAVDRIELMSTGPRASTVRIHTAAGAAQFVSQMPVGELRSALEPYLMVDDPT